MPMIDLAYSEEEIKERSPKTAEMPMEYNGPKYPWGLTLYLEKETLAKLGWSVTDFKVGETVKLDGRAMVVSLSMSETQEGSSQCVNLQITELSGKATKSDSEIAALMFDKG